MNTHVKVHKWIEKMEYQGRVPNTLPNICNASTAPLWEELIQNVMQKGQVEHIRNNNLINRLRKRKLSNIPEVELWERRRRLAKELASIKQHVSENEQIIDDTSEQNKIKYVLIENTKRKIRENELKSFMFKKKSAKYEKEIEQVEEKLTFCRNLTPIESQQSKHKVLHTLNECVKKMEKLMVEQDLNMRVDLCSTTPPKSYGNFSMESSYFSSKYKLAQTGVSDELNFFKGGDLFNEVKQILHRYKNESIWMVIEEMLRNLKLDLLKSFVCSASVCIPKQTNISKSFAKLHCLHLQNELIVSNHEQSIRQLVLKLNRRKNEILDALELSNGDYEIEDKKQILLLQVEEAGQNAVYECLLKQLESLQSVANFKIELKEEQAKALRLQQEIVDQRKKFYDKFTLYKKIQFSIHSTREETFALMRKLNQFSNNLCWALPLTRKINTNEIKLFRNFPLEYNKHIKLNRMTSYRRDLTINENVDSNTLRMLVVLIQCPSILPETMFLHHIQNKVKGGIYKSLQSDLVKIDHKKYSLTALQRQEDSYVEDAINKLNSIMKSCTTSQVSLNVSRMEKIATLWLEMQMKNFVSPKRLFNDHNMEYYQCLYDLHYNELE